LEDLPFTNKNNNRIYTLYSYDSVVLLFTLNEADGSLHGTQLINTNACNEVYDFKENNNLLYMTYNWTDQFLTVFEPGSDTVFNEYQFIGPSIGQGMAFSTSFIFFGGSEDGSPPKAYLIKTLIELPDISAEISLSTSLNPISGSYGLVADTINVSTTVNLTTFTSGYSISDNTIIYKSTLTSSNNSVSFYEVPLIYSDLISNQTYSKSLLLTCNNTGETITYSLTDGNNGSFA